ncbi:MAG TPA: hypothetical protein VFV50_08620 [Bdellovibrionales bacterium]|nr:hypothetical protein [Bdellovibrionales bacterium]
MVLALALPPAAGCSYVQKPAPRNITDYIYAESPQSSRSNSRAFEVKRALDGVAGANCRWLPSDSRFFERTSQTCGPIKAVFLAMGRALEEPDIAAEPAHPVVNFEGSLRWIHMPLECGP